MQEKGKIRGTRSRENILESVTEQEKAKGRIRTRETLAAEVRKFTLFSNTFLSVALEDVEACQHVLRILSGKPQLTLRAVKSQYTISELTSHDAWLDVLAEDIEGRLYALEVQQRDTVDHPRRVRFYGSMVDSSFLRKGEDYGKLPEVWLYYIGAGDFLRSGKVLLGVEKILAGTGRAYEDGMRTVYVNAGVEDGSEVSRLMAYFKTADPEDMGQGALSERVRYLKKEKEGVRKMCEVTERIWKWGYESGEEAGLREGRRRGIRKGEHRGEKKGMQKQARQTAYNLALMGMSAKEIARAVGRETQVVEQWLRSRPGTAEEIVSVQK